jgi:hypothetical protein
MRSTGDQGWSPRACAKHGPRSAMLRIKLSALLQSCIAQKAGVRHPWRTRWSHATSPCFSRSAKIQSDRLPRGVRRFHVTDCDTGEQHCGERRHRKCRQVRERSRTQSERLSGPEGLGWKASSAALRGLSVVPTTACAPRLASAPFPSQRGSRAMLRQAPGIWD